MTHVFTREPPADVSASASTRSISVMSIDVEDWFQVENLKAAVARETWDRRELRVERNVDRMLTMMSSHNVICTCFILGWIAEKCPQVVRRIAEAGHEVASHGYGHELVYSLTREAFRQDVLRSKMLLEDLVGSKVRGYRAPNFSITDWAIDVLQESEFEYDSSAFPTVAHDRYGRVSGTRAGQTITRIRNGFLEISVSCLPVGRRGVPWGGGGYFRILPYRLFRGGVRRILNAGQPYVFYIHPWEVDPAQPRISDARLGTTQRLRHYANLQRCEGRWDRLLADFRWVSIADLIARCGV